MTAGIDQFDVIITDSRKINTKKKQAPKKYEFKDFINRLNLKGHLERNRMNRLWGLRNLEHGGVFANSLEVDYFIFQQNIYIEESKVLTDKLKRLGFVLHTEYPDAKFYKAFCKTYYDTKYNISLCLYNQRDADAIITAFNIVPSKMEGASALAVFLSAINVLLKK